MQQIAEALAKLDPDDDQHWTTDGAPRIDAVGEILGAKVTRDQVVAAAPRFSRTNPDLTPAPPPAVESGIDHVALQGDEDVRAGRDAVLAEERRIRDERDAKVAEAKRRHAEVNGKVAVLMRERAALTDRIDELVRELRLLERYVPNPNEYDHRADMAARMDWIRQQRNQRANRVGQTNEALRSLGITGKSALDSAMGRKNSRGTQRPQFPKPDGGAQEGRG